MIRKNHVGVGRNVNIIVEIEGVKLANFKVTADNKTGKENLWRAITSKEDKRQGRKWEETGTTVDWFAQGWTMVFKIAHVFNLKEFCLHVFSFPKGFYHVWMMRKM